MQLTLKQEARLFVDKGDRRDVNNGAPAHPPPPARLLSFPLPPALRYLHVPSTLRPNAAVNGCLCADVYSCAELFVQEERERIVTKGMSAELAAKARILMRDWRCAPLGRFRLP